MKRRIAGAASCGVLCIVTAAWAAAPAYDDASDQTYATNSWPVQLQTGYNGGYGFGPWTVSPETNASNAGFFLASASQNGGGPGTGGAIDATSPYTSSPVSWGFFGVTNSDGEGIAAAYRGFTGGPLSVGQVFSIDWDNGYAEGTLWSDIRAMGFVLRTSNSTTNKNDGQRLEFLYFGSDCGYRVFTNSTDPSILICHWTRDGQTIRFALTGPDTYSLSITQYPGPAGDAGPDGWSTNIVGTLGGTPGSSIDSVALYNQGMGPGPWDDVFFNRLAVGQLFNATAQMVGHTNAVITFGTGKGSLYDLQESDDLTSGIWSTVVSNIVGTGGMMQITNAVPGGAVKQFYRARLVAP